LVELVGIEKLGTLKTDKLLICRESYNAQKASNACNAGFIVRLLYGDCHAKNPGKFDCDEMCVIGYLQHDVTRGATEDLSAIPRFEADENRHWIRAKIESC
jgi:hypothetical protein